MVFVSPGSNKVLQVQDSDHTIIKYLCELNETLVKGLPSVDTGYMLNFSVHVNKH